MTSTVEALIERVLGELHTIVQTRTVVGEPLTAGDVTLIPVSRISLGFGAGGGSEVRGQSGTGTGGGASVEPIAFVVIDARGRVQVLTLKEKEISWGQLIERVPEAVAKVKEFVDRRRGDGNDEEKAEAEAEGTKPG